eukprot:XP_001709240.1 Hypothetical protein GL50803_38881 [Giardia lamblia ATCC 50803]
MVGVVMYISQIALRVYQHREPCVDNAVNFLREGYVNP